MVRITASEAIEISGVQAEMDMIDAAIKGNAEKGERKVWLEFEHIRKESMPEIFESLQDRGFRTSVKQNPIGYLVEW